MIKYYKNSHKIARYTTCLIFLLFLVFNSVSAKIPEFKDLKDLGLKKTAEQSGFTTGASPSPEVFIGEALGWLLSLLGVIFVVLMIYGGYTWILAMGNEENAKKAKDIMVNATIGIVIVFTAYAITNFLISNIYDATKLRSPDAPSVEASEEEK